KVMPRVVRVVLLGACALVWGHAAQFLVVTRAGDNSWAFEAVDTIQINGKDKVRAAALGSSESWDSKAINHLAESRLADFTVVRRLADGALAARAGENEWRLLLPGNTKSKTADTAGHIWGEAALEIKKDRNDKTATGVPR